jgi:LAO/AO transport system kinase
MSEPAESTASLIQELLQGSRRALGRILSRVENRRESSSAILHQLAVHHGHALRIGFTGPPGAGKSSLVTSYVKLLRQAQHKVGILAVDPTSPFSGGALLGDRVRMNSISLDPEVFVRSVATRGDLGGLAEAAGDMADVFDAAGFDTILFETVGVGQSELEIAQYADCTAVVLVPESGDAIQGMKAGLMEIADVFVINKSDREGSDRFAADLRAAMQLKMWEDWIPPVVSTIAVRDQGIQEMHEQISRFVEHLHHTGTLAVRRTGRIRRRVQRLIEQHLNNDFWTPERRQELETAILEKRSPYDITQNLLKPR